MPRTGGTATRSDFYLGRQTTKPSTSSTSTTGASTSDTPRSPSSTAPPRWPPTSAVGTPTSSSRNTPPGSHTPSTASSRDSTTCRPETAGHTRRPSTGEHPRWPPQRRADTQLLAIEPYRSESTDARPAELTNMPDGKNNSTMKCQRPVPAARKTR